MLAIGITNLVFTIIIHNDQNKASSETNSKSSQTTNSPVTGQTVTGRRGSTTKTSTSPAPVSQKKGFKDAAQQLLRGLDQTLDPCEDFYAFTCNNYLKSVNVTDDDSGQARIGTYDEAQEKVYDEISQVLDKMDPSKVTLTEQITKNVRNKSAYSKFPV